MGAMSLLKHPAVVLLLSLVLGGTFLYSSWHKVADPPDFAHVINNYKLVPPSLINPVAILMPWFEVFAGLAVLTGFLRRGGAMGLGLMTLAFIAALGFNLYRGHPTICGCFGTFAEGKTLTEAEKFFKMKTEILLDVGLFALCAVMFFGSGKRGEPEPRAA